jgi:uncharacterized membrane protein
MGLWIFIMLMNLITPLIMVGSGKLFSKSQPKTINWAFGYRTSMSMKNEETWRFAHEYCGKVWQKAGLVLLISTVIIMFLLLLILGYESEIVGIYGTIIMCSQIVILLLTIIPTEKALRKEFDKDGNRRVNS